MHPILTATSVIDEALKAVADTNPTSMPSADKGEGLKELVRIESLERLDPKRLPVRGGDATAVVITITLATLMSELGAAEVRAVRHPLVERLPNGDLRFSRRT